MSLLSVPAGNAIQAFGYGMYNTQNKNVTTMSPSATSKTESDWSMGISDHPSVMVTM